MKPGDVVTNDRGEPRHGFVQVSVSVLGDRELSAGAKCVYAALQWYAWRQSRGGPGYQGQEQLAADVGLGPRSVRRYLAELEGRYIQRHRWGQGQPDSVILVPISGGQVGPLKRAKLAGGEGPDWPKNDNESKTTGTNNSRSGKTAP
jgi:hypothetical protein